MKNIHPNILAASIANNIKQRLDSIKRYYTNPNRCQECKKVIRIIDESVRLCAAAARSKRFCNHSCASIFTNRARWAHLPPKDTRSKQEKYLEMWLAGLIDGNRSDGVASFVRRWLITTRGEACEECGWKRRNKFSRRIPIQVHHIDGDDKNSVPENLQILCPSCHSLTETYCGLNINLKKQRRLKTRP